MKKKQDKEEMKERITITIDKPLLEWLDKKVSEKIFASRSHGFEFSISKMEKEEKNEENESKK